VPANNALHKSVFCTWRRQRPLRLPNTSESKDSRPEVGNALTGAKLVGATLAGANDAGATLVEPNAEGGKLTGAGLAGGTLTGATQGAC
jgi:uncharacterized protein YjbI with pentapeptide repeats